MPGPPTEVGGKRVSAEADSREAESGQSQDSGRLKPIPARAGRGGSRQRPSTGLRSAEADSRPRLEAAQTDNTRQDPGRLEPTAATIAGRLKPALSQGLVQLKPSERQPQDAMQMIRSGPGRAVRA